MKMKATHITGQTLVASGNCFSVLAQDGKHYNIVNFSAERLKGAIEKGILEWPVDIRIIGGHIAIIDDVRIPEMLYRERYCECCCPYQYLPESQKDRIKRDETRRQIEKNAIIPAWDLKDLLDL